MSVNSASPRRRTVRLRMRVVAIAAAASALAITPVASATDTFEGDFGRMFPRLPSYTTPTDDALQALAASQLDPGAADNNNPAIPAGFTFLGQFIDHDLTLDTTPLPDAPLDPTTIMNERTARFDLDSVYGNGPYLSPQLYGSDGAHLAHQDANVNGEPDLARLPDGTALIGDERNDENLIIAQLHLAVIRFHNRLIDAGLPFENARRLTQWHYQWAVVHDYLPHVAGQDRVDRFLHGLEVDREFYRPRSRLRPMTPVEFSVAAFRFGHSQVRNAYRLATPAAAAAPVFALSGPDLRGGRPIPTDFEIEWTRFFEIPGTPPFAGNVSRKIDTKISAALFNLPSGPGALAARNLIRGKRYGLPGGKAVASRMGIAALSDAELAGLGIAAEQFGTDAPLWYYALAESELREGGTRLGEVAGRIVAEVFLTQLAIDKDSYLNARFPGFYPMVPHQGEFGMGDFLQFAGVA